MSQSTPTINTDFKFEYGVCERISPLVRRIVAPNPGPYTFVGTSTYIIGNGSVAVIDPGPAIPDHIHAITHALQHESVSHILVTHTHSDHSSAANTLHEITGAPTWGFGPHGPTSSSSGEAGVDRVFVPQNKLTDNQIVNCAEWAIEAVHTPGHCSNHLCFSLAEEKTLFCGDHLMAWSTTVILPPDGSLRDYLNSLKKLKRRTETLYRPTHGPAITNPISYIDEVIHHRETRIEQIFSALQRGNHSLSSLRQSLYPDLQANLFSAAEMSILSSILFLEETNRINRISNTL